MNKILVDFTKQAMLVISRRNFNTDQEYAKACLDLAKAMVNALVSDTNS